MGKKPVNKNVSGKKTNSSNIKGESSLYPFVSICTPTFNRRPFWPMAIECFNNYDYPKDRMEWIIVDDGSDNIEDLVKHIPQVRYFREEQQMVLGRKRNFMHEKAKGDIIVYQDDDDYYPPERVKHAVERLMSDPKVLAGGSTVLFLYFKHISQMYRFGPYGDNHATAGTFAFKRELLKQTKYDDYKALAEERDFLKDYTIPFIQFDPLKSILVFSHNHNTFDKKRLLEYAPNPTCNPDMNITVDHIIKSKDAKKFFLEDIDNILETYEPGDIKNKPEVLNQTVLIEQMRTQQIKEREDIRRQTLLREDVKKIVAESDQKVERMRKDMSRIFEVNKQLVHRMKSITHLLTDSDKALIEENDKAPPIVDLRIINPVLNITQADNMCNIDKASIDNIFNFIANHDITFQIEVNNHEKVNASFKANLQYTPHRSQQHLYTTNNISKIDLNQALGGNNNASEEDIATVMEQTECNRATALNALSKENGDVIACIMNIDNYKCDDSQLATNVNIEDVNTVMEQTGCTNATAVKALSAENGDVIACIMNIDKYTCEDAPSTTVTPTSADVTEEVQTIMEQTGCNKATAEKALQSEGGDVISCVMNIDKYTTLQTEEDTPNVVSEEVDLVVGEQ